MLLSISYYDKLEPELELELQQTNGWLKVTKLNDVAGKAGQDGKEASESINNVRNQRLKKNVSQLKPRTHDLKPRRSFIEAAFSQSKNPSMADSKTSRKQSLYLQKGFGLNQSKLNMVQV